MPSSVTERSFQNPQEVFSVEEPRTRHGRWRRRWAARGASSGITCWTDSAAEETLLSEQRGRTWRAAGCVPGLDGSGGDELARLRAKKGGVGAAVREIWGRDRR